VLILDEATSSLDANSEKNIMQLVGELQQSKTIIAIAHRLNTVKNCDKILYLKDGEIEAEGPYSKLLENNEFNILINTGSEGTK
jgi:ABC-type multidrug transport system fused ATPase/permease subunit